MVSPEFKQFWVASGVILNAMTTGFLFSYMNVLLPVLREPDSPIKLDLHSGSWLSSTTSLSAIIGIILSSVLLDWIGRTRTYIWMLVPQIFGWIFIFFASNITNLFMGRILGGLHLGSSYFTGSVIISEYTSPEIRGVYLSFKSTFVIIGVLLVHTIGPHVSWRVLALMCSVPSILVIISTFFWPESPSWLATKGRYKKSEEAFYLLRGTNKTSVKEFKAMIKKEKESLSHLHIKVEFKRQVLDFVMQFKKKNVYKPILVTLVGRILVEFVGRHTFPSYATYIISHIIGDLKTHNYILTLAIDIIAIITSIISSILMKFINRRTLLFFSGVSTLIFLICICSYLFLVAQELISISRVWIPITLLVIYYSAANIGCTSIPLMFYGELFSLHYKGANLMVVDILSDIAVILTLKLTPIMLEDIKLYGTFSVNGIVIFACLWYLYSELPETRNKTLQEIEEVFDNGRFLNQEVEGNIVGSEDEEETEMIQPRYPSVCPGYNGNIAEPFDSKCSYMVEDCTKIDFKINK